MVNAHPEIAVIHETHWIPRLFKKRNGLAKGGFVTPQLISHLFELPGFTRLGISREELPKPTGNGQPIPYSEFVTAIFDLYGKVQGKALVGDKTPSYVRRLRILHNLWPRVRFVHLIRDGRDVCLSMIGWQRASLKPPQSLAGWKDHPVSTAALWWELNVRSGRQAAGWLEPEFYHEFRYESLVNHPAEECERLCAFLHLPYDDRMLRFHEGRTRNEQGLNAKDAWLPVTPGLRNWRSQMSAADVERFEAAAGELLDELDYPRAVPHLRKERLENASRIRRLLAQDPRWSRYSREFCAVGAEGSKGNRSWSNGSA